MTLTFELVQDIIKVNPCTKFHDCMPKGSAVRVLTDRQTDRQTRLRFYNLDREVMIESDKQLAHKQFINEVPSVIIAFSLI